MPGGALTGSPRTVVGRSPSARGITIFHGSISRQHAELTRAPNGTWFVADLGSANGTRVDENTSKRSPLTSGATVTFGTVGFVFTTAVAGLVEEVTAESASRTLRPGDAARVALVVPEASEVAYTGLPTIGLQLLEAPSGGGGYLAIGDHQIQVTDTQFGLMRILACRIAEEQHVPPLVRGFVPSGQLIADLPWDSVNPSENNLKQLVRRVRRMLDDVHLGTLIESRRGFGYRLRAIPREPFDVAAR